MVSAKDFMDMCLNHFRDPPTTDEEKYRLVKPLLLDNATVTKYIGGTLITEHFPMFDLHVYVTSISAVKTVEVHCSDGRVFIVSDRDRMTIDSKLRRRLGMNLDPYWLSIHRPDDKYVTKMRLYL